MWAAYAGAGHFATVCRAVLPGLADLQAVSHLAPMNMQETDIVIAGGGLVGLTAALALASGRAGAPFRVVVVDAQDPRTVVGAAYDGRNSSIAYASWRLFEALGIAHRLQGREQPINDILVTDGKVREGASPMFLHFAAAEIADETGSAPLGHFVENRHLREALLDAVAACDAITLIAPARVQNVAYHPGHVDVSLDDGSAVRAALCVAADGRGSPVREQAGIRTVGWGYDQAGIVTTMTHDLPHEGVAQEYFLPGGPFAVLPMTGNRSSLVWTEKKSVAADLMALDDAAFAAEAQDRFGSYLGACRPEGPRWSYPLSLQLAREYVRPRLALVGDAAHAIHPLAGQGYNLGVRDVAALVDVLVEARDVGLDIGALTVLDRYQRWRRFDSTALAAMTDGLNRLFSNDIALLRFARDIGLDLVNRFGPARRLFMRQAAGAVGELPRLMRG
ncbi:FAD-dependent monooxygenase [Pyruvatibacter sp.]|uniref:FAD-dependent monooxygenase n=1 Tax=Pyruvatibacter sp. TaxID=1981328 RepID=UPI0032EC90B4